jgi:3-methyladenine DNA glycosylase AlkC
MSQLLKDIYSPGFYDHFSDAVRQVMPSFDKAQFLQLIFDKNWENKELKDRMKHTALVLKKFLPESFEAAADTIQNIIIELRQRQTREQSVEFMFFPDYIEKFGIEHFNTAIKTFEFVTQFTSCEFAVRPFIIKYGDKMIKQMERWSLHESHHVRRLASEGSRPRLPWAIALPELKKNPNPILPILEKLKTDPSEYVRRSVANNLNDISKDNPELVIKIAKQWKGCGKETDAIIKHGCRTLLKQGHSEILSYYQLSGSDKIQVEVNIVSRQCINITFNVEPEFTTTGQIKIGDSARIQQTIVILSKGNIVDISTEIVFK